MLEIIKNNKIAVFLIFILLLVIFILLKSGDNWKYSLNPVKEGSKIVAFGDSLTYGYQLPRESSYPSLLSDELEGKYAIVNYGVNGNTTIDGLNRFEEMIESESPELIILGLGGNDILRRVSPQKTKENLIKMIDMAKVRNAQVILLPNPEPSVGGFLLGFNDYYIFKEVSEEKRVPVLHNTYSKWLSKNEYKIDKIHLNKEGYHEVAKEIKKQFIDNGLIGKIN